MSTIERTEEIFENFHAFDDGLILSFEYSYLPDAPLAATIVLYARDHAAPDKAWRKVKIVITEVQELCAKVRGNDFNAISAGVKLLQFGELWCVDVDGTYALANNPGSLDEVRRDGHCYIAGRDVSAYVVAE